MKHRRVRGLGAVLSAEHPERQLGVVDHESDYQSRPTQPVPVGPGPLNAGVPGQVRIRRLPAIPGQVENQFTFIVMYDLYFFLSFKRLPPFEKPTTYIYIYVVAVIITMLIMLLFLQSRVAIWAPS